MKNALFLCLLALGVFVFTTNDAAAQANVSYPACVTDGDGVIDFANSVNNCYFRPESVEFEFVHLRFCEGYPVLPAMDNCFDTGLVRKWFKLERDKVSDSVEFTNYPPAGTYTHVVAVASITTKVKAIAHMNANFRAGTGSGVQTPEQAGPYCTMQEGDWSMSGYIVSNYASWSARCFATFAEAAAVPAPEMDLDNLVPGEDNFVGVIPPNGYANQENIIAILDANANLATANTNAEYMFFITERQNDIVIPEGNSRIEIGWDMTYGARIGGSDDGGDNRFLPIVFIGANTMVVDVYSE